MSDKISESSWKAFVKKQKLTVELADKDLLKALVGVDRTDERKPEQRIAALKDLAKEIPKQVTALTKQKKELGDKPFGLLKDELYAMLAEGEALQKKTQEALDAKDEEPEDEDSAAAALVNPKQLLKQLMMCKRDPDRKMKFAFVDGKGKDQPAMLAMHLRMKPRALFGKLQEAAGVKTGAYGTAWVDETTLMLQLDKPLSGLVKKIRPTVKACGFRITKAVLWNEDGSVFEADESPEDKVGEGPQESATSVPKVPDAPEAPPKPSATYEAKLAALEPRVKKAAAEGSGDAPKHQRVMEFAAGKAKSEDFLGAMAALKQVEQLLDNPGPKGEPGAVDAGVAFKARMGALIPKLKEAATAAHPAAQDAKLRASEAGTAASKGDFAKGQALLDEVEDLLAGKLAPSNVAASKPLKEGDVKSPLEKWNAVRLELQPRVDAAVAARGEQAGKISTAWALALESAGKGDFPKAEIIAQKLRDILPKPSDKPAGGPEQGKPEVSTANVDAKTVLLEGRQEVSRIRVLITAFGATCPPAWLVQLAAAEKAIEDSANGTLTEIEAGFTAATKILKALEPLVTEMTAKKVAFEKLGQSLETKSKELAVLDAIKNSVVLRPRHAQLQVDLDAAREKGKLFDFDAATAAVEESLKKALQLDKEADGWNEVQAIFAARAVLVGEAATAFNALTSPPAGLTAAHDVIVNGWAKVIERRNAGAFDEARAASDALPALIEAFKRKAFIFEEIGSLPADLTTALNADKTLYGVLFDQIYPKQLIDLIEPYGVAGYELPLDDKAYGEIRGAVDLLVAVRKRAKKAAVYIPAAETLTKASRDVLADEPSRRALRYIAPDFAEKIQEALSQGKTAANRQDFEKAVLEVAAGQTYADEQQRLIQRCKVYLALLDKTNAQLEKAQQQYTTASAKNATQACMLQIQEAETQALAQVFDAAERLLMAVQKLLTDIAASEEIAKSLEGAKAVPTREAGSADVDKDIVVVESAIKAAEENSSKSGVSFEWGTLATAKLSLAAMRRANGAKDAKTLNDERQKALTALSTLTEQLSSYKTCRSMQTALQAQLQTADTASKALPASTLAVLAALKTEFTDIKTQAAAKVDTPLAAKTQPAFDEVLQAISALQTRLASWQAAAKSFVPFSTASTKAEAAIKALETTDVPAVTALINGLHATFKTPLSKLPVATRLTGLRTRKNGLDTGLTVATLAKSASDMTTISTEALAFKKEAGELKTSVEMIRDRLSTDAVAMQTTVTEMKGQVEYDRLLKTLEAAAQSSSASGIRIAGNETQRYVLMLTGLGGSRANFLNIHTQVTQRIVAAKAKLTALPKSKLIAPAVTALLDQQLAPASTALEQLKTKTDGDSSTFQSAEIDIRAIDAKVAAVELAATGFGTIGVSSDAVEKQLTALAAFSHLPPFKDVVSRVEAMNTAAGQLLSAVPPDFAKAKASLEAATQLAATAILGAGKATAPEATPKTSTGATDYKASVQKLRSRVKTLETAAATLLVDPKPLTDLQTSLTEIETLSAEAS